MRARRPRGASSTSSRMAMSSDPGRTDLDSAVELPPRGALKFLVVAVLVAAGPVQEKPEVAWGELGVAAGEAAAAAGWLSGAREG